MLYARHFKQRTLQPDWGNLPVWSAAVKALDCARALIGINVRQLAGLIAINAAHIPGS
jgi:hypothetical protein